MIFMKPRYTILFTLLFFFGFSAVSSGQNCARKNFCDNDLFGDFDYRSQSSYAVLIPGDTARTSIVVYSKQTTRILVCNDPVLGEVHYKIYETKRVTEKSIVEINTTEYEEPVYKYDEYGQPIQKVDEWTGEPLYDPVTWDPVYEIEEYKTIVEHDTVWKTERVVKEIEIYDSRNHDSVWQEDINNTRKLIIEVIIPEGDKSTEGCVSVLVGYKPIEDRGFRSF